ncbi:glycosyltransferase [Mycolicibacterium litorale]|uniref:glycosyltransferase n=1 Tax=Mycolicibacterium litorale TaxID=758802 RepID=UPI00399FF11D
MTAIAPGLQENVVAANSVSESSSNAYSAMIVDFPPWRTTIIGKLLARVSFSLFPVLPDIGACAAFLTSKSVRERLRQADIVEIQWFEYFVFARLVKRVNPRAELIGFVHDVPSQRLERKTSGWPSLLSRPFLGYVAWLERVILRALPKAMVLSSKDAVLLAQRTSSTRTIVVNPPLDPGEPSATARKLALQPTPAATTSQAFGFIAAFQRPENEDAALWLLSEIWPSVLARCPSALLYLVGSKPSPRLQRAAREIGDSVIVTGYVEDLDSYYNKFETVIIPLRHGAGVKFKTLSGILAGKNIVATSVGIEGTLSADYFFRVTDSAHELAQAMAELAADPSVGIDIRERARRHVGSRYSLDNYARSVVAAYFPGTTPREVE